METEYDPFLFNKSLGSYSDVEIPEGRIVLLFIMEQTPQYVFLEDLENIPAEKNFFERVRNNSHVYTNFYTSNQDSRTALWALFNSQFIPFESYTSDWNKRYGVVTDGTNLIEFFKSKNYATYIVCSVYDVGLLLGIYDWDNLIFLESFDENNREFLCVHNFEYQKGCEDMIFMNDLKNTILENKDGDIFLVQEFIFGHGTVYMDTLGKSRTEYYNDYLFELYTFLENEGLTDKTTIIIISDHGNKGYLEKELRDYQIPLVVVDSEIEHLEIDTLYSQIDFKDILISYMTDHEFKPNPFVIFMGQTASSDFGYIDAQNNYFLGNLRSDYEPRVREMSEGFETNSLEEILKLFFKYRHDIHAKSSQNDYFCEHCNNNIAKVAESRKE